MSIRFAFLAAASPLALVALPAEARVESDAVIESYSEPVILDTGDRAESPADTGAAYAHEGSEPGRAGDDVELDDESLDHRQAPRHAAAHGRHHHGSAALTTPRLAYGPAERTEWLAQCRALHRPVEPRIVYADGERRDGDGALVGGLIGVLVGAGAGNRIADRHRLAGTLVGAGIGGIAGAVIGSVIDNAHDREEAVQVIDTAQEPGFDYCEAYLLNYERGYGVPGQVTYAPVVMAPVITPRHAAHRVIEEEIVVEAEEPAPRHHRVGPPQVGSNDHPPID